MKSEAPLHVINTIIFIRPKCVFAFTRPTLIFGPDPKLVYDTFSETLFRYPIFAFKYSFWCLRDHYFDKKESNVTLVV